MFLRLKNKLAASNEKARLLENIFSLGLLQGANYILPLLTIPYLVRVLGADYYGLLAFATAIIMYLSLLADYGFNLSATRQIAIHRGNKEKINEIFSSVIIIKTILTIISFIALLVLIGAIDKIKENHILYLITFGIVVGQTLFPVWFFQGIESMKYITYVNIFSKSLFTIFIFIFVNNKSDYLLVPFFTSLGSIIGGIWSLYFIIKKLGYKFSWQPKDNLLFHLKDGWHVFYSSVAISLYTISTTVILGFLTNNSIVGQFSAIEKIIQAAKGIYQPISQAIYPLISKKINASNANGLLFVKKVTITVGLFTLTLSFLLFFFSDEIIALLLGQSFTDSAILLEIMAPLPFVVALSNIFGIQVMLNLGLKKSFSKIISFAAIIGIILSFILVPLYQAQGTAITLILVELFVTSIMLIYLKTQLPKIIKS